MSGHFRYIPHVLALAISAVASSSYALEAISDEEMSDTTGEGLAFLPENFSIVFDPNAYINLIPVGPVTTGNKADIFLYGLALGKSNVAATALRNQPSPTIDNRITNDTTVSNISSWGTGVNPWLFRTTTITAPAFQSITGVTDGTGQESRAVISFEAPDFTAGAVTDDYNLKMVMWADIMSRNSGVVANNNDPTGASGQFANRLRLQAIWDGFSVNGTQLNLFQTAKQTTNPATDPGATGTQTNASQTLGLAGLIRFNSLDQGVLRFSTALKANETDTGTNAFTTGATGGALPFVRGNSTANQFEEDEGLYIRNLDVNLPLGQLHYQPLIFDASGSNIIIELARIPNYNKAYDAFYVDYRGITDAELSSGQVDNVTRVVNGVNITAAQRAAQLAKLCTGTFCGSASITGPGTVFNATPTHGSINMGNVSFRNTAGTVVDLGSASIQGLMIQHLKLRTTGL